MSFELFVVILVLVLLALSIISLPWLNIKMQSLFLSQKGDAFSTYKDLCQQREMLLENLEELENDYHTGKISKENYEQVKEEILGEAAKLYDKIEDIEENDRLLKTIYCDLAQLEKDNSQ